MRRQLEQFLIARIYIFCDFCFDPSPSPSPLIPPFGFGSAGPRPPNVFDWRGCFSISGGGENGVEDT